MCMISIKGSHYEWGIYVVLDSMKNYAATEKLKLELIKQRTERVKAQIAAQEVTEGEAFFTELLTGKLAKKLN